MVSDIDLAAVVQGRTRDGAHVFKISGDADCLGFFNYMAGFEDGAGRKW